MSKNTIINNPVNIHVQISKAAEGSWEVKPSLIAFPTPRKSHPKNIIFLLDNSGSMQQNGRLEKVKTAVKNHLFAAICGYVELQRLKAVDVISNCYKLRRELFNEIIASFIEVFTQGKEHLNPKFQAVVNA